MAVITEQIANIDWQKIEDELNEKRAAFVPSLLPSLICQYFIDGYDLIMGYRNTVIMKKSIGNGSI